MTKHSENTKPNNSTKHVLAVVLIFCRFSLAFLLGMLPFTFSLKSDWYVIPLIVFGFVFQFENNKTFNDIALSLNILKFFQIKTTKNYFFFS